MFSVIVRDDGEVALIGRLDASQTEVAGEVFDRIENTTKVSFEKLDYISSAGLGLLLKTQKRLSNTGQGLVLTRMNKLVRDIFKIARFDVIFQIEETS
ncbi:MAG TPA: STAS domain-containing protein [Bacteroidota bacterium]|nr:STAS domain-containing protein [Bacteroidota bacterium]